MTRRTASLRLKLLMGASAPALMLMAPAAVSAQSLIKAPRNAGEAAVRAATQRATLNASAMAASQRARAAFDRASKLRARLDKVQADARAAAQAAANAVPNGLGMGGLQQSTSSDAALSLWIGAEGPQQTVANGQYAVTIKQTQEKAILSWDSFNIGRETTLTFNQGGNASWIALNRVTGNAAAPSQILGKMKSDGTVMVVNANGIIFGGTAQINTRSLIAGALDVGPQIRRDGSASTIAWRNDNFLRNGLLGFDEVRPDPSSQPMYTDFRPFAPLTTLDPESHARVEVAAGAVIESGEGGMVLLTAPEVVNAGRLTSKQGQVILAAGTKVALTPSTGGVTDAAAPFGANPNTNIRGLVAASQGRAEGFMVPPNPFVYTARNAADGIIDTPQGNVTLIAPKTFGKGLARTDGLISATTSVSRNGSFLIDGTNVQLGSDSLILIAPDSSTQTIPQDPVSIQAFKPSWISIGENSQIVTIESGSMALAPGANMGIGRATYDLNAGQDTARYQHIYIDNDATINLAGLAGAEVATTFNQVIIDIAKKNELRDSPLYRDGFLNGATIYLDPSKSGVREDGVAWIGSPLIDAAAYYQLAGVSAGQMMTEGGALRIGISDPDAQRQYFTSVVVRDTASIDLSGGWVEYLPGRIRETMLVSKSGRIVPISEADPADIYVAIHDGFVVDHSRWQVKEYHASLFKSGVRNVAGYIEGADAGSLTLGGAGLAFNGQLRGEAFAGTKQIEDAREGSATSGVAGDPRHVQGARSELPSAGAFILRTPGSVEIRDELEPIAAGDYSGWTQVVYPDFSQGFEPSLPDGRYPSALLADDMMSTGTFGAVAITAQRHFILAEDANVSLAAGGAFVVDANAAQAVFGGDAAIRIDGNISIASGTIDLEVGGAIPALPFNGTERPAFFRDILVNGDLSVAGRWVNDFGVGEEAKLGGAFLDGGTISIKLSAITPTTVNLQGYFDVGAGLPLVFSPPLVVAAEDLTGDILIGSDVSLNLASGARIDAAGHFDLTGRGGNLTLANAAAFYPDERPSPFGAIPPSTGFRVPNLDGATFQITLTTNPSEMRSKVEFDPASISAHGFAGGGTFSLTTPEVSFSNEVASVGTNLPMAFISSSGFANFVVTSNKTELTPTVFGGAPGRWDAFGGYDAYLATQTLKVRAGETLDLTQSLFSNQLSAGQQDALMAMASGGDVRSIVSAAVPTEAWDRRAVSLSLNGMLELHVEKGGMITGAAGSVLNLGGLLNEGTIRIMGGTINQRSVRPGVYADQNIPTVPAPLGFRSLDEIFTFNEDGMVDPLAMSAIDPTQTNWAVAADFRPGGFDKPQRTGRLVYKLGLLDQDQGIVLAAGSVTDLSGGAILNPRAATVGGAMLRTGRMVNGGTLGTEATRQIIPGQGGTMGTYAVGGTIEAARGSVIDVSGASATFDQPSRSGITTPVAMWSDGGTIAATMGGNLSAADIDARGGSDQALGGTLRAGSALLSQTDELSGGMPALATFVSADMIDRAGFDTLVAIGNVGTLGDVNITLGRAFLMESRPSTFAPNTASVDYASFYSSVISTTGELSITAPYIGLKSVADYAPQAMTGTPGSGTVTFNARQIDLTGAIRFDRSVDAVTFNSSGDLRLIGTDTRLLGRFLSATTQPEPGLAGLLLAHGDINLTARQIYPTTGSSFNILSSGEDATIALGRVGDLPAIPYSAGGDLLIQAAHIVQGGVIRVPFGELTLGGNAPVRSTPNAQGPIAAPATQSVVLTANSVTSVSADGLSIPYGTTTDTIEWYFAPTSNEQLTGPPLKVLSLNGVDIRMDEGATVDLTGGGDVYAYEFVPGTGGSRDILDAINPDQFSGNLIGDTRFTYTDGRQVYAIVPGLSDNPAAAYDPIYSAGYDPLYSASGVGRRVYLDAAPGVTAGWYTLLPAKYALLPGGMRVVEQTEMGAAVPGTSQRLSDGTVMVSGRYGDGLSGGFQSQVRMFSVQSADVVRSHSNIAITSGNAFTTRYATDKGLLVPRIGLDSGRLSLNPLGTLEVNTLLDTEAAEGGRGAQIDIAGAKIRIVAATAGNDEDGTLVLAASSLNNLNAESLLIGGSRIDNVDGTTQLLVTSQSITVANDAANPLMAPEIILAVDDGLSGEVASELVLEDGATIIATGELGDTRDGAYVIDGRPVQLVTGGLVPSYAPAVSSGIGALFRVANGPERLVQRLRLEGAVDRPNSPAGLPASLSVGNVNVTGESMVFDTSHEVSIASAARLDGANIALGANSMAFTDRPVTSGTVAITPQLQAVLSQGDRLTLRAQQSIGFDGGAYRFGDVTFDATALVALDGGAVTIDAGDVRLANSGVTGTVAAGNAALALNADELTVGSGTLLVNGFGSVELGATGGVFVSDRNAVVDFGGADVGLATAYIGDRKGGDGIAAGGDLTLRTTGALAIDGRGLAAVDPAKVAGAPGAAVTLSAGDISIAAATVRATAGTVQIRSNGGIALSDGAAVMTPGFVQQVGDSADPRTILAPGGTLSLVALGSQGIALGDARLSVGGGIGNAGSLTISAANGAVDFASATLDGVGEKGGTGGRFRYETLGTIDLVALNDRANLAGFTDGLSLRSRTGDLVLGAGQTLRSGSVELVADGGLVTIGGTIDTSGIEGGDIALFGARGVTLEGTAKLASYATGYASDDSRVATAGDITIGTGFLPGSTLINPDGSISGTSGAISIAAGAVIDATAHRPGSRLVQLLRSGQVNYMYVEADRDGIVTLRAPVVTGDGADTVNISVADGTSIRGTGAVDLEGYRQWDLAGVAASGLFTGVIRDPVTGAITLDVAAGLDKANDDGTLTTVAGLNFLGDEGTGTLADFVQSLDLSASYGSLGGLAGRASFSARPGIELLHTGDVTLASNWNLGAGVVNVDAAIAGGVMAVDPVSGQTYVRAGREAELLAGYTRMTYRVGGDPDGAAPLLAIRASGDLHFKGSLTDGFFQFREQYDPVFQSYLNAQSRRLLLQLLTPGNAGGDPNGMFIDWASFVADPDAWNTYYGQFFNSFDLAFTPIDYLQPETARATVVPQMPYSALGNSPAALAPEGASAGNALASAVVMPLLPNGDVVTSASYRLTGGAALLSTNPWAVDPGATGSVRFDGGNFSNLDFIARNLGLLFGVDVYDSGYQNVGSFFQGQSAGDFESFLLGLFPAATRDSVIALPYESAIPDSLQAFIDATLAADPDAQVSVGPHGHWGYPDVAMSIGLFAQYLAENPAGFLGGGGGGGDGAPLSVQIYNQTTIRTGTGNIRVDAARNVDLTGGPVRYVDEAGQPSEGPVAPYQTGFEVGGAAVYTAGRRFGGIAETLKDPVTGADIRIEVAAPTETIFSNAPGFLYGLPYDQFDNRSTKTVVVADTLHLVDGGRISLTASGDIVGRKDQVGIGGGSPPNWLGQDNNDGIAAYQPWRLASTDENQSFARINPQAFREGVATFAGGGIDMDAGGSISDLTIAADTSLITTRLGAGSVIDPRVLVTLGSGDVSARAIRDIVSIRADVASGNLSLTAGRDISPSRYVAQLIPGFYFDFEGNFVDYVAARYETKPMLLRFNDGATSLSAGGTITLDAFKQLDGYFTDASAIELSANGDITLVNSGYAAVPGNYMVYPGTLRAGSTVGDVNLWVTTIPEDLSNPTPDTAPSWSHIGSAQTIFMLPSPVGQLSLLAGGTVSNTRIVMSDIDQNYLPGLFTLGGAAKLPNAFQPHPTDPYQYRLPIVLSYTSDAARQRLHNVVPTHIANNRPIDIMAGEDIGLDVSGLTLWLPKQARISAGRDILNMMFFGQNVSATDVTRISAGRDIVGDVTLTSNGALSSPLLPTTRGNTFILGGPGRLSIEAGRDLGPFLPSADIGAGLSYDPITRYPGGIVTVGNQWNPNLAPEGAHVDVMFGVGKGVNFDGLREAYVKPGSEAHTVGDYGTKLIAWMKANAAGELTEAYATQDVNEQQAYEAFAKLPALRQRDFLLNDIYFNELRAPSVPGESYLKYSRGYTAVNTLFPPEWGYTENGLEGGASDDSALVRTGNLDLRLATIETLQGGNINILGPGGRVLAGSVVSTAQQAARRYYFGRVLFNGGRQLFPEQINAIPTGFEGIVTQQGGNINTFTDGDFLLNQSRLFTVRGGDITMWSSNDDLNAGQGAKTTANFPPVVVHVDENATAEEDNTGSTTGAGIAAFNPGIEGVRLPDVYLLAPRGTVDAGDAGVRVAGNLSVAALSVANANNFQVEGSAIGIPLLDVVNTGALLSANAATSAVVAEATKLAERARPQRTTEMPTILNVRFLGFGPAE